MASIDSLEVLKAIAKQVRNATEVGENTAERVGRFLEGVVNWLKDQNFDEKYLRKDIEDTAQQLIHFLNGIDVKGHAVFNDTLSTEKFISGFTSGKGWAIWLKDFINAAGVTEKLACMELDELTVRKTLKVFEFIISQMRGENDNVTFSGFMKVDHYDAETGRIYLKTDDGQLYNPFRVDDYLYCQQFNGMPSEKNDYTVIKTYEFIVTDAQVGSLEDNEKRLDWITLKNFAGDLSLIAENDVLVRLDNLSNPDRKGIIQLMTVGNATPYIDILYGTKTDPDNSLKGRLGNLQGIYHHLFGWLQSFGAYLINLYAVGDFRMRQTGESLDTKIEMTRSLFQTRFQKLSYELTEEDNYLTNATFTENLEGWERENDIDFITMNDEALLLNRSIVTARRKVADIQEYDGQNMLCISNSYIRQLNANIRKPGTHKEYTKVEGGKVSEEFEEVGDTLYLSLKFLCKKSGVLTVGFEGSSVSDDTLPYTTFNVASSVDWQIYKWSGKWDGTGDFVLKFTGDMFVSLLAITDNPLNDYKKEVSTSIEQTHSNIRLLGQNINTLEGTVTNLGIDLDAAEEQISIYAEKVNTLEGTVTNLGIRLDAAEGNISIYASKVDSLEGTVTNLGIDLDAAEEQISIYAEKVTANVESIAQLRVDIDSITSTVVTIQGDIDGLEDDVLDAWYEGFQAKGLAEDAQETADEANSKASVNATAISQNATDISLLSASIDANSTSISELRVTTKSISSAVTSVESDLEDVAGGLKDAKDRIEEVADIAESAGDAEVYNQSSNPWGSWPSGSEYKHVGALWYCTSDLTYGGKTYSSGHTYRYIGYDNTNSWEDVTNIQSSASYVVQNKDKISTVVASFDSDGNLTNTSGLVTTSYASSVYATKTTVDELSGRVTTAEASIDVHSTQISLKVSKDGVISAINQSSESITIDASKINLNGYTNVNDTFSVDESGNIIVSGILKGDFEVVYAYQMSHANYTGYWYICNSFSSLHSNNVYLSRNTNQDYAPTTNATTGLPVSCPPSYCHLPATAYGAEFFVYNANNYASVYLYGVTVLSGSNVVKAKSAVRCKCVGYGSTTLGYIFEAVPPRSMKVMRVNLNKPIVGFDKKPLLKPNGEIIQMKDEVCLHLFNANQLKGVPLSDEQKYNAYSLCMRISENPESVEMTTEDGTLIKGICYEKMSAGAYGQVVDVIENKI